jgi:hypothetical protein
VSAPTTGRIGPIRVIWAKRLKNSSSGPNTMDGRRITARGKRLQHRGLAQRLGIRIVTLAVLVRADGRDLHQRSDALLRRDPGHAGGAVMLHEAEGVLAPLSARMPTQFTTASAPWIAARTLSSSRILARIGST